MIIVYNYILKVFIVIVIYFTILQSTIKPFVQSYF